MRSFPLWSDFRLGLGNGVRYGTELAVKTAVVVLIVTLGVIEVINAVGRVFAQGRP